MPKSTYLNLSDSRKEEIMEAAREEFSNHTLETASVANIIRKLNIARGTFYKYFDDLEELYFYFFRLKKLNLVKFLNESLEKAGGKFVVAMDLYTNQVIEELYNPTLRDYYRNFFISWNDQLEMKLRKSDPSYRFHFDSSRALFSDVNIPLENSRDFYLLLKNISHDLINRSFYENWSKAELKAKFELHLSWLRNGIGGR